MPCILNNFFKAYGFGFSWIHPTFIPMSNKIVVSNGLMNQSEGLLNDMVLANHQPLWYSEAVAGNFKRLARQMILK
ncbi:hypothetical protein QVD17_10190 [Tagetes erecta]|uniref:Uncharacterized protein n=1 Tax=Tagetes erecta TaxID=13708 RepID=A0AAD8L0L9_TARER|nr:hypothetical protein QVD17_10190 [Tagetes erecta]